MKIKNIKLEWNVLCRDFGSSQIKTYNVLGGLFPEKLAKDIKKHKIENRDQLKDFLKTEFMHRYWSRSEYEIVIGGLFSKYPDEFEKIDIWRQIEMNFDNLIDYIIREMQLFMAKGDKNERNI